MNFPTSEEAEEAFYSAMRDGDVDGMRSVWAEHDSIACVHPGSEPLLGRVAVMEGWMQILHDGIVPVQPEPLSASVGANLAIHLVNERVLDEGGRLIASVVATNVYELGRDGWRMLLHHGSQTPAAPAVPQQLH